MGAKVSAQARPSQWNSIRLHVVNCMLNLCIVATPQDPNSWLLYRGGRLLQWNLAVYSGHPSGPKPNQLAAIQRWPAHTVEHVYSGHPSGLNQLTAIQRWPAHTVEPVYSGHPSGLNQLTALQRWPAHTVEPVYKISHSSSSLS